MLTSAAVLAALLVATPAVASSNQVAKSSVCRSCIPQGVSAIAKRDAWLVGYHGDFGHYDAWSERWDGASWRSVDIESPGVSSQLFNVDARSGHDAWAVGTYFDTSAKTLIEHWDGTGWSQVESPSPGDSVLYDVDARSAKDAWAVGHSVPAQGGQQTLILHWDGTSWTQVPSPNPKGVGNITLRRVSADSKGDAWALGSYFTGDRRTREDSGYQALLLHWNGTTWKRMTSPSPMLLGVSSHKPGDAWAVGTDAGQTVTDHWDGQHWSRVSNPSPEAAGTQRVLQGVASRTGSDAWAVGTYDSQATDLALVMHWDGSTWTQLPCRAPPNSFLYDVSADRHNDAWAIGISYGTGGQVGLIVHWDGTSWT